MQNKIGFNILKFQNITLLQDNQQFQRIYLDLPGMGESPSTPNITNSDEMLAYIVKFIDALNLTEPLALVGHSYGGYLSIGLADYWTR